MERIVHAVGTWEKTRVPTLISDKVVFMSKLISRGKEAHQILVKGIVQQEKIIIINIYASNTSGSNFTKRC